MAGGGKVEPMETNYLSLLAHVVTDGEYRNDRTGVGTLSLFGAHTLEMDLSAGRVPLMTTKRVAWKKALTELLWILRGESDLKGLEDARNIWEPWADGNGQLGGIYGPMLRGTDYSWEGQCHVGTGEDQLYQTYLKLHTEPATRQAVISLWNPRHLRSSALPPCPFAIQFSRRGKNLDRLDMVLFQRSADMFLGVPFDLFEYSVLQRLMAHELGIAAGKMTWVGTDVHLYTNAVEPACEQLGRGQRALPYLTISQDAPSIFSEDLTLEHFNLVGYNPQPALTAEVAV